MILYDENGSPVSLDLEAVQNAINTLGSLTEDNDMYFEEASADELAAYYEDYLALMDADNAFAVAEASEVVSEAKNNQLHNNRDMKDVIKANNNQIRDINKRMRKALRRKDFDEADKLCEQGLSISKATYAEIKKMPASVIGNIIPIAIGSIIAAAALASAPIASHILKKSGDEDGARDMKGKLLAAGAGTAAGTVLSAITSQVIMIRQKHKEAMRKANSGEDVSKEMNWCKAALLSSFDRVIKSFIKVKVQIKKAKSEYKTANVYDDADSITKRIKDINKQLDKDLSYDPKKAGQLKAEKQKLMQKLNSLS